MNTQQFIVLLNELSEHDWQAVIEGQSLIMVDDFRLELGEANAADAIIQVQAFDTAESVKQQSVERADDLLHQYYLTRPLTRTGFNRQVKRLFDEHGREAFAAAYGELPARSLFVDCGEVVAEAGDSPRHRYGAFCEIPDHALTPIADLVERWMNSGEAYERYLSMNVCRYNC